MTGKSDDHDHVSMHHRLRRSLRKRLKHLATELEKPVTDIVNEAITAYVERMPTDGPRLVDLAPADVLAAL